ncbi:MAG: LysM peptidoglycan-binding domain-containing protein, partial [Bdellovibrionales bacterium]|nr:LysM peptidoglycan-binding domain-containing protein [Bdellovibrionales bacterium]
KKYFENPIWAMPVNYHESVTKKPVSYRSLLDVFDGNSRLLDLMNPHFTFRIRKGHASIPTGTWIRVLPESVERLASALSTAPQITRSSESEYVVESGDTIIGIAKTFGVSTRALLEYNDVSNPKRIRPGQKLLIPKTSE